MMKYPAKSLKSLNVVMNDKRGVSSVATLSEDITIRGFVLCHNLGCYSWIRLRDLLAKRRNLKLTSTKLMEYKINTQEMWACWIH